MEIPDPRQHHGQRIDALEDVCAWLLNRSDKPAVVIDTGHPHRAIRKLIHPQLEVVGLAVTRMPIEECAEFLGQRHPARVDLSNR